ncbi:hypothetical protein N7456_006769 [Penicillium angulare]|uniref:Uncharacterized protein n=1 Tax=Penicillium angulare TaxID=116970 RepID=A0A9W9FIR1_9EURO|nr:hypothetical protein N7456_006769 [Penicillium angulare]
MASLVTDSTESASGLRIMSENIAAPPAGPSLMQGLPDGCTLRISPKIKQIQVAAKEILDLLEANEDTNGNQWLVILGLSPSTIRKLDDDHSSLGGMEYRFQWEGSTGLIKVVPSHSHDMATDYLTRAVDVRLVIMGIHDPGDRRWASTATYKPTAAKGKQGDQTFLPPSRCPTYTQRAGWPTFVIETGVSESIPRLREDAKWWLATSSGDVRMVLIVGMKKRYVSVEMWQLAPSNAPRPLTQQDIDTLRLQVPPIPPMIQQQAVVQQPYCAQEVTISSSGVQGAPLIIPFYPFFDRPAQPGETDIVLDAYNFECLTRGWFP